METKFIENDSACIFADEINKIIPYVQVEVPTHIADLIDKGILKVQLYQTDGMKSFRIAGINDKKAIYILLI